MLTLIDKETKLNEHIMQWLDKMEEIKQFIAQLDDALLEDILIRRYIQHQRWEQIAVALRYTWRNIHTLHIKALDILTVKSEKIS